MLDAFARWFASAAGVWQTAIAVIAVSITECFYQDLDPHAFILMAVLTVYSAITQPALAYVATKADNKIDHVLIHLDTMVSRGVELDEQELEVIKRLANKD